MATAQSQAHFGGHSLDNIYQPALQPAFTAPAPGFLGSALGFDFSDLTGGAAANTSANPFGAAAPGVQPTPRPVPGQAQQFAYLGVGGAWDPLAGIPIGGPSPSFASASSAQQPSIPLQQPVPIHPAQPLAGPSIGLPQPNSFMPFSPQQVPPGGSSVDLERLLGITPSMEMGGLGLDSAETLHALLFGGGNVGAPLSQDQ